ncbi:hypothetical protein [Psychrobacter sp. SWN149]|uniref:hypothetical protein n=1 Tax=Psychrobacter sp. SWN149 TaxID=2792057 RepID=UPI0018CF1785|nr:hypothetical protein [Psychrobacter sp. SWN149]MBH0005338.1 hypothetical protein [Psychrobacter sp. SWN149]
MENLSASTLKTVVSGGIIAAVLAVTTGCVTTPSGYNVYDDIYGDVHKDDKEHKKHKDKHKKADKDVYSATIERRAANKVSSMGYRVKDVKYKKGDRKIKVEAERGRDDYKIELGYPSYNVIKIKKD